MTELLRANILVDLAYYRRSRLLLAFMLMFLLLTALGSLPPLFGNSGVQTFNALHEIFTELNGFLLALCACLGLFIISSHLRNRSLKMVFTKPCPPALWLLSAFLSAVIVSLLLSFVVLTSMTLLSLAWHVPVRPGLVFLSAETFVVSVGLIAYLMLLATLVHPAVAAICTLVFNAYLFYDAQLWTDAVIRSGNTSPWLRVLKGLFHWLYLVLPMLSPFGQKTEGVHVSLRVMHGEWKYLLYSLGYALTLSAFCYCVSLFALQRKKHI
jgi:ABC-type transport system involved in multi-copper enzyme maturation permease subunit